MKNWKTKAVSALLALSVLVPTAAFATDAVTGAGDVPVKKGFAHHGFFNEEKRQELNNKLLDLVTKYTPESLEDWKNALAKHEQLMKELKEKRPHDKQRPQLSNEAKDKIKAIYEDVKSGKLTREQAREQLKNLGIEKFRDKPELPAELKEKLKAINENVKNGKLTPEQAREEMKKLGFNGRKGFDQNNLRGQFRQAVEANDETKIKELLPRMLEQLKEKNQALSNKLAETNK